MRLRDWLADALGAFGLVFIILPGLVWLGHLFS